MAPDLAVTAGPSAARMHWARPGVLAAGAAVLVLAVAPWFAGQFVLHLAVLACLNVLMVNGLSVIDRAGQLSFGHAAPVALGAYAAVLLSSNFGLGSAASLLAALVLVGVATAALGWVILRLRGVYFVLVTFAFAELVRLVLLDASWLTGGASGIAAIPPLALAGFAFDTRERFYALALVVALLSVALMMRLFARPLGRAMLAVGANPALAESIGLSVLRVQLAAYVIGSMMAALGGVLTVRYIGFVSPESFATSASVAFLTMLVVGGRGSLFGPVLGALVLTPLPELFRGAVQLQQVLYGAALIVILRFLPGGIASLMQRLRRARTSP